LIFDFCLFWFLILPLMKNLAQEASNFSFKKGEIEIAEKKKEIIKRYEDLKKDGQILKLKESFIDPNFPISFANFIDKTSQDLDISLSNFSLLSLPKTKKEKTPSKISFSFTLEGEPENLLKFTELLENSPFLLQIEELNLFQKSKEKTGFFLSLLVSLQTK
ncbi:hypothetical protein H5T58_02900, partial [Candidatus Parcubacteria bacterium]|nr:hypothetical protein [Candidatus Parcubacteria bacterium]